VYFVTGNHEYFSGGPEWVQKLGELGIRVLRNERVRIAGGLDLIGVDDLFGGMAEGHGMDLDAALQGRDPAIPGILLAHQPVVALRAKDRGLALQLSGHTHGGQIYPFHHAVRLVQPWLAGLQRVGDLQVYVHRGSGYWGPPFRIGAPGEIARIELV
jgi:predicted MPP superfamily phosphohydrolase